MLEQGKSLGAAPPVAPHPPRVAPNVIADVATLSEARFAMIEAQLASQAASISCEERREEFGCYDQSIVTDVASRIIGTRDDPFLSQRIGQVVHVYGSVLWGTVQHLWN